MSQWEGSMPSGICKSDHSAHRQSLDDLEGYAGKQSGLSDSLKFLIALCQEE